MVPPDLSRCVFSTFIVNGASHGEVHLAQPQVCEEARAPPAPHGRLQALDDARPQADVDLGSVDD